MKRRRNRLTMLLCGICCLAFLGGCGGPEGSQADVPVTEEAKDTQAGEGDVAKTFRPSDLTIPRQDEYDCPYMGLTFSLPEGLMERMDKKEVAMLNAEEVTEDETTIRYALMGFRAMTEQQRDMEVESGGNGFYDWVDSLSPIGAIGAYESAYADRLDELTGCSEHTEIGKSEDGKYTYYLSVNPEADSAVLDEIKAISYEITDLVSIKELMGQEDADDAKTGSLGDFSMKDIEGNDYTQEMFADYELTMVNVFTTWCTPCINEIPDLEKLRNEMADQGVNVVGIVLDAADGTGGTDEEAVEKAKTLAERTGVTYPFLIPDAGLLNGRLSGINAVPETFFVDKDGNIVGETYSGSRSLEEWKSVVEQELKGAVR